MSFLADRAAETDRRLAELARELEKELGADAARILRQDTCIYVVGSGGRGEMSAHSDADLFVARVRRDPSDVDALFVRQSIARALFRLGFPDPSQGGAFLAMHTDAELCGQLGTPQDDAQNTLTARMLLLLEGRVLVGAVAYDALLHEIMRAYWTDAVAHQFDHQPFTLVNDIVRYWRILLLNYVAKNAQKEKAAYSPTTKPERRLRSYKLRFSRCMTCFSMLASLLVTTAKGSVDAIDVLALAKKSPVERLQALQLADARVGELVAKLLELYEAFLGTTAADKKTLLASFADDAYAREKTADGNRFGDTMFDILQVLGASGRPRQLFRHMVV